MTELHIERRRPPDHAAGPPPVRALGRPASLWDAARHVHTFASTILDRVFLLGDGRIDVAQRFDVAVRGLDELHAHLDQGRGMLLFGSHLGSFEVLRVLARQRPEYTIRVVLDKAHNPALTQLLEENPELDVQHLRTLIRNARKEQAENKPPKAYREIFQILKDLGQKSKQAAADDEEDTVDDASDAG